MEYSKLSNTWSGLRSYNLNGKNVKNSIEKYGGPVTMSLNDWREYVASGKNTLEGSGGVIPSGRTQSGWTGQAVYSGHVRQGYGYM